MTYQEKDYWKVEIPIVIIVVLLGVLVGALSNLETHSTYLEVMPLEECEARGGNYTPDLSLCTLTK